jgi:hypothetical protein
MSEQLEMASKAGGMNFAIWVRAIGIHKSTAYRWLREGKIRTVTRHGVRFVTTEFIREFFQGDASAPHLRGCAAKSAKEREQRQAGLSSEPLESA